MSTSSPLSLLERPRDGLEGKPVFHGGAVVPSSSHKEYHPRAIQIHGRPRFEGISAHQDDYRKWDLPEYQHHGAHDNSGPRKTLPFTGSSTYSDIYKVHPMEPYSRAGPANAGYKGSGLKFDADSSYANDFGAKELPAPTEPFQPRTKPLSTAKFDGTSSYAENYPAYDLTAEGRRPAYGQKGPYQQRNIPFTATSAYEDTYKQHDPEAYHVQRVGPDHRNTGTNRRGLPFEDSTTHKDAYQGWKLEGSRRASLGIATVGDRLHILIPSQLASPVSNKQVFTTVHDGQTEMCMMIYQGSNPVASSNKLLGQFQLVRLAPAPVGVPRVKVTFKVDANDHLTVEGEDLGTGDKYTCQLEEGMVVSGTQPRSAAVAPVAVCA